MQFDISATVNFSNISAESEDEARELVQRAVEMIEIGGEFPARAEGNEIEVEEA